MMEIGSFLELQLPKGRELYHQEKDVAMIFSQAGLSNIKKVKDFNGIYRALSAVK